MILLVLRALFILLMAAVGWSFISHTGAPRALGDASWLVLLVAIALGAFVVLIDIFSPRRKLAIFSGTFLGLLVGIAATVALTFLTTFLVAVFGESLHVSIADPIVKIVNLGLGLSCCYLAVSFVLQTKDDFRFVIPYVEFSKQTKGAKPILIDTSILIDGRIIDIAATGVIESQLVVPRFVLEELQLVADSADKLKRARGRRGLDMLTRLRDSKRVEVLIYDAADDEQTEAAAGVDQKLLVLAKRLGGRVLTTDFNLNKVAQLHGIEVININDLSNALKPVVLPGEKLVVRLINPGEAEGQAVGYLDDGTMVVVEQARPQIGQEIEFTVNRVIQTSAGRMIFGRLGDGAAPPPRRPQSAAPRKT